MTQIIQCELCGRRIQQHASYIVRMDVFADPSTPPLSSAQLDSGNFDEMLDMLLEEMKQMSADDLQDAVHRRFEFRLCLPCQQKFLANPLGKPRIERSGTN